MSVNLFAQTLDFIGQLLKRAHDARAQERGLTARNVVRDMRGRRKGGERRQERRQRGKLKVGVNSNPRGGKGHCGSS